jgi:SulP family sulfate permease
LALFGGLPATGAIARTATNVRAGGTTPVAGLIHAVTILIVILAAARWGRISCDAAMAALVLTTAWNMSEPHKWRGYGSVPVSDRVLLLLTLLLTALADQTVAIGVGVGLGLALRLRESRLQAEDLRTPEHQASS